MAVATELQVDILREFTRSTKMSHSIVMRAQIVLGACSGIQNRETAAKVGCHPNIVSKWKMRWIRQQATLAEIEGRVTRQEYKKQVQEHLSDEPRSGNPGKFSAEQLCQIIAVACDPPEKQGRPVTHWAPRELADEVIKQEIVESISVRHIGRFLKGVRP